MTSEGRSGARNRTGSSAGSAIYAGTTRFSSNIDSNDISLAMKISSLRPNALRQQVLKHVVYKPISCCGYATAASYKPLAMSRHDHNAFIDYARLDGNIKRAREK